MTDSELGRKIKNIDFFQDHEFRHVKETGSTNDDLKSEIDSGNIRQVLLADFQTCGRGQYQRKWLAEPQTSLLFSFSSPFAITEFPLSLRTGVAVIKAINLLKKNKNLWLKWPNDIFCSESKLGGILVESQIVKNQMIAVVGIGINLESPGKLPEQAMALRQIGIRVSANRLLLTILQEFAKLLEVEDSSAAKLWANEAEQFWQKSFILTTSAHSGQKVRPLRLNSDGSLVISADDGTIRTIKNGSLTLIKKSRASVDF
jgi:BirA family biotin operon repressor/biotin-[acetyl-CoA-carboxylase] ligase